MSSHLPFGIESKSTFASLSPADLESLGKEASATFLCNNVPLNDAIVKIARRHPSISHHQVQRIIEYANQETFSKVFEKMAGDKNVEFVVADPGVILHELNNGARGRTMTPPPSDYGSGPTKLGHSAVEADLHLARLFGVDPVSPHAEKTAAADRIESAKEESALDDPAAALSLDPAPEGKQTTYQEEVRKEGMAPMGGPPMQGPPMQAPPMQAPPMGGGGPVDAPVASEQMAAMEQAHGTPGGTGGTGPAGAGGAGGQDQESPDASHHDRMMGVQRDIEFAKKRGELQAIQQKSIQEMGQQPGMEQGMPPGGAPPGAGPGGPPPGGAPPPGGPPPEGGAPPPGAPPPGAPPPEQIPPPMAGPVTAPPGAAMPKTGSALTKEAMVYAKSGRPHANLVLADLDQATSLEFIKQATAERNPYPEANRYGDLIRAKEKLARVLGDAMTAVHKNASLCKEAEVLFQHEVTQHMFQGGNLGEVLHAINSVRTGDIFDGDVVKEAVVNLTRHLISKGMDPVAAQAETIAYEMEKGASLRIANPESSIVQTFATLHKLATSHPALQTAYSGLLKKYTEVENVLSEAMVNHVAAC